MPTEVANRDYWANNMNEKLEELELPYRNPEVLQKLQEVSKQFNSNHSSEKRNQAHVCSFFLAGKCNRGKACPYRHDNITDEDIASMQKGQGKIEDRIKNRFNGVNDSLAQKLVDKIKA